MVGLMATVIVDSKVEQTPQEQNFVEEQDTRQKFLYKNVVKQMDLFQI